MKKILTLFTAFCFAFSTFAETEFTFTKTEDASQTKNGIIVTWLLRSVTASVPVLNGT